MAQTYSISVPDQKLAELKDKLASATFPDELEDAGWDYGTPLQDVKRLAAYWKDGYDWRKHEADLNLLPNFMNSIDINGFEALDIHFVHRESDVKGAIPLLFVHGWPGSFIEVTKLLGSLTEGAEDAPAFHVVAPSLPNFGFSSGVKTKGFGMKQYAETCHKLMLKLGYEKYVTQGGDWGTMITRTMSLLYPKHLRALHINLLHGPPPTLTSHPFLYLQHLLTPYNRRERHGQSRSAWFSFEGSGYNHQQSTKPQTIGYALQDSPVALLAWILEKLHEWTDGYPWSDDEILTWVSIYQFSTAGPAASVRIYYETLHAKTIPAAVPGGSSSSDVTDRVRTRQYIANVPLGVAHFPQELSVIPKTWARTMGPVVLESEHEHGGHFAAHERPEAIVADLRKMFGKGGPCHQVVKGRSGYGGHDGGGGGREGRANL